MYARFLYEVALGIGVVCLAATMFTQQILAEQNPPPPASNCPELVWEGEYEIYTIEDLKALSGYTSVTGNLLIDSPDLDSLKGLECLNHIGGSLLLWSISDQASLRGLGNLTSIGGDLVFYECYDLTTMKGLKNLTSIGGALLIKYESELCKSLSVALRDQELDAGGIGGWILVRP
jgi:hypothetical protein